jgi:magnesium-protoporphyrin IX monomethyl ester (oxidative) cyclase
VFPLTLDTDNPRFRRGLERLRVINVAVEAAKARGGLGAQLQRAALGLAAAAWFTRLYFLPTKRNATPQTVRMAPAW